MTASRFPAVVFDIDGTLVDSSHLHVHAWARAISEVGIAADAWRIHRSIGMDGSTLVKTLSGDAGNELSIIREGGVPAAPGYPASACSAAGSRARPHCRTPFTAGVSTPPGAGTL